MQKWEKVTFANPAISIAHLIRQQTDLEKYKNVDRDLCDTKNTNKLTFGD